MKEPRCLHCGSNEFGERYGKRYCLYCGSIYHQHPEDEEILLSNAYQALQFMNFAEAEVVLCPVTEHDSKAFENFAKYADKNGNGIKVPAAGDTYTLGSAQIEILAVNSGETSNDSSIVLKIKYGDTAFLFVGDAEAFTEELLIDAGADVSATVLKVGHHGSESSTGEEFLAKVSPKYVARPDQYSPTKAGNSGLTSRRWAMASLLSRR